MFRYIYQCYLKRIWAHTISEITHRFMWSEMCELLSISTWSFVQNATGNGTPSASQVKTTCRPSFTLMTLCLRRTNGLRRTKIAIQLSVYMSVFSVLHINTLTEIIQIHWTFDTSISNRSNTQQSEITTKIQNQSNLT